MSNTYGYGTGPYGQGDLNGGYGTGMQRDRITHALVSNAIPPPVPPGQAMQVPGGQQPPMQGPSSPTPGVPAGMPANGMPQSAPPQMGGVLGGMAAPTPGGGMLGGIPDPGAQTQMAGAPQPLLGAASGMVR